MGGNDRLAGLSLLGDNHPYTPTGGQPPFIGQTPVVTQAMVGGQPFFFGNPSQSWGPPQGGTFHQPYQGGPSYPNLQGGVPNPNPSGLHFGQPLSVVPNPN
jgi:hypothetical protein